MKELQDSCIDYGRRHEHPRGETYTQRMRHVSRMVTGGIVVVVLAYVALLMGGYIPGPPSHQRHGADAGTKSQHGEPHGALDPDLQHTSGHAAPDAPEPFVPHVWAVAPFAALLLCIAVLPLLEPTQQWWHHNRNRFMVAAGLGVLTLLYYGLMHPGGIANHFTHHHDTPAGWPTAFAAFSNAMFAEFIPFIILLFSLYVISGGINLRGDLPAHPRTNSAFIGIGTLLASFIGTTGAAMVLIRPLLATNAERRHKVHTVIFFIFMVCNCGGLLLPIGDPPLFLGYLKGVPFVWTIGLWPYWLGVNSFLLLVYFVWDSIAYRKEEARDITRDETEIRPLQLTGKLNLILLLGVVFCVAFVVPDKPFMNTAFHPPQFFREALMLILVVASLLFTHPHVRVLNRFDYTAIAEVGALFCGIFLCMQVPVEILNLKGASMGIDSPVKYFWAVGMLSSFLDNAPTYVVFFETAKTMSVAGAAGVLDLVGSGHIMERFLVPISLGAVFMGANTYIGNGPNFMVKSIAEQSGIKMPSFFGYMLYSSLILLPVFVALTLVSFENPFFN